VQNVTYGFTDASGNNNGNVMSITNNLDSNRSETFTYDSLNRIAKGQTTGTTAPKCFGASYIIDQWSNLKSATALSG
jgi:hypothetical protein